MRFFIKAVATGFALSMGGALFKKVSKKIGLDTESTDSQDTANASEGSRDDSDDSSLN